MAKRDLLQWVRKSPFSRSLILLALIALVIAGISVHGKADSGTEHDLYTIQSAILKYYNESNSLPGNLNQLHIKSLKHHISQYRYTPTTDPTNATTVNVELCANFHGTGSNNYSGSVDNSVSAYDNHHKGFQCFSDTIYKSQSHIAPEQ